MAQADTLNISQNPHLDRWHYMDFRDGKHDAYYIEWKYFNFIQEDFAGYFVYYILSPEGRTRIAGGRLLSRIFKNGKSAGSIMQIPMDAIVCDAVTAGITMGGAQIIERNPYEYDLTGATNEVSWTLGYKQKTPTIESFQNIHTGMMKWERASWLIKMPKAAVTGEIRIHNEVFPVNAVGYSDTNWGEIVPLFSRYEWGQYNDNTVSFVFGIMYGFTQMRSAYFYFTHGGHSVALKNPRCSVEHVTWARDKDTGIRMPSTSNFVVRDGEYEVVFALRLMQYDTLGLRAPWFLPRPVISEQMAQYAGNIKKNGIEVCRFDGAGFKEWSARTWKKASQEF